MTKALERSEAGRMRIVGEPAGSGLPLTGLDVALEILQENGEWLPLRGVTQFRLAVMPDQIAIVHDLTVELQLIDVSVLTNQIRPVPYINDTRPLWRRWRSRIRIFLGRFRIAWTWAQRHGQ